MEAQRKIELNNTVISTDPEINRWAKWIHLSLYATYFIPVLGFPIPFILWHMKKKQSSFIDEHGKIVANYMINLLLYVTMFAFGLYKLAGFLGCFILFLIAMIYPIMGARMAKQGKVWEYPLVVKLYR